MNLETIWKTYQSSLKSFLHSKVSHEAEVDDLLQDILLKVHENLHTLQSSGSIKAWLFQIANRCIVDFYRKQTQSKHLTADQLWYTDNNDEIKQELAQCLQPLIQSLPPESAQLLQAIDLQEQSQKRYAQQQGIPYSTLKSRVQKARTELYQLFSQCCSFAFDQQGNVMDFEQKHKHCRAC